MRVHIRSHRHVKDGEWSRPARKRKRSGRFVHGIKCCDCGLQHIVEYALTKRGLKFRAWRLPKR